MDTVILFMLNLKLLDNHLLPPLLALLSLQLYKCLHPEKKFIRGKNDSNSISSNFQVPIMPSVNTEASPYLVNNSRRKLPHACAFEYAAIFLDYQNLKQMASFRRQN